MDLEVLLARVFDRLKSYNYKYSGLTTIHEIDDFYFQTHEIFDHFSGDDLLNRMVEECEESRVIYDIGSNVGSYSIGLAKGLPDAEIHSFEPNPEMVSRHECNLLINDQVKNHLHTVGISDETGSRTFYVANPPNRSSFSREYVESVGAVIRKGEKVSIGTIDEIVNQEIAPPPDAIKLDVEGHAEAVLRGAKNTLDTFGPTIYLGPHHTYERSEDGDIREINRENKLEPILQNLDYDIEKSDYEWICRSTSA
jgi:FkbM family methyltransferase